MENNNSTLPLACKDELFINTVESLIKDLKENDIKITCPMRLIIEEIATLRYILRSSKHFVSVPFMEESNENKLVRVETQSRGNKKLFYDPYPTPVKVNEFFDHSLLKIQKGLILLIRELENLIEKQLSKDRIKIVSKLKKRVLDLKNIDTTLKVDAIYEKEIRL